MGGSVEAVGRPGAHDVAEEAELADVIRVVIAHDPNLPEDRVSWRVGDNRDQVGSGGLDDRL